MKKVISLFMAIGLAVLTVVPVFADGRGPTFTEFDVVCPKSIAYYRENWDHDGAMEKVGTFSQGTTLKIVYEYEENGVLYGSVRVGNDEDAEWMYVRMSDVEIKDKTYLPENAQKLSRSHTVRVIEKGGISLYAGPNKKYDTIGTIPRGTKLTYTYGNDKEDYYRTWAFVTYLNKSGWIYVYSSDTKNGIAELPEPGQKNDIWVLEDGVKMFEGISFGNIEENFKDDWDPEILAEMHEEPDRVVGTLEKGKKYTYRYSHGGEYEDTWYYVTAGLRSGWVHISYCDDGKIAKPVGYKDQNEYMTFEPIRLKLHKTPDKKSSSVTVNISKNTVLNPEYVTYTDNTTYYYGTIQGQSGWYALEDISGSCAYKLDEDARYYEYFINENDEAAPIYDDILKNKIVGKIPADSLLKPLYCGDYEIEIDEDNSEYISFYYVRYNDMTGWVDVDDLLTSDTETTTESEEETEEYEDPDYEEEWDDESWDVDESEEGSYDDVYEEVVLYGDSQSGLSPLQIVLICVVGAAVLALTAAVTLLLIRRKQKGRTELTNEAVSDKDTENASRAEEKPEEKYTDSK